MNDLGFRSAVELAAAIRRLELSSLEVLDHLLERVDRLNPRINAVVTLDASRARSRARELDALAARGEFAGPLHGVPMTVKDTYEVAGVRTTSGAEQLAEHVPERDAVTVARLKAAGAVIFGKTNTPTWAADAQTYNPVFGTTNNPWDVERTPGGSSGGSAAALAAGLTPLEIGSDIGGSIRIPAHYCGVYGHKPTYGIVPIRGHIPGLPGTRSAADIAVAGPLARTAGDLALAMRVIAGPDEDRAIAWRLHLPPPRATSVREYRVAVWTDDPACPVDDEVRERILAVAGSLAKAGAKVHEAKPDLDLADASRTFLRLLLSAESGTFTREQVEQMAAAAGDADTPTAQFVRYTALRHREWLSANEKRLHLKARWDELFRDYDVLLCPIVPTAAIPHDQSADANARTIVVNGEARPYADQFVWAGVVGMAFLPATMAPAGLGSRSGLPVGVQIVGPYLEDYTPIDVAGRLADLAGGFQPPPGY